MSRAIMVCVLNKDDRPTWIKTKNDKPPVWMEELLDTQQGFSLSSPAKGALSVCMLLSVTQGCTWDGPLHVWSAPSEAEFQHELLGRPCDVLSLRIRKVWKFRQPIPLDTVYTHKRDGMRNANLECALYYPMLPPGVSDAELEDFGGTVLTFSRQPSQSDSYLTTPKCVMRCEAPAGCHPVLKHSLCCIDSKLFGYSQAGPQWSDHRGPTEDRTT